MSVPLARRLAGPSFSHNVRFDQAWMTKRKEQARQDFKLGETKVDYVSEREVFDVKEGEILVSKQSPGRISDGYARVFSSINGWQGMPANIRQANGPDADAAKKAWIKDVQFIGVAVTATKQMQNLIGFVACISGIVTVMNESQFLPRHTSPMYAQSPIQHGIHARKVRFHFRKALQGEEVVGKALSYSKKGSTVDILLHPVKYSL